MKLVVWNCNGNLSNKFDHLAALKPDVAVISECEQVDLFGDDTVGSPSSIVWIGDDPRRGLGVLTFGSYSGTLDSQFQPNIPYFAPVRIRGPICFNLLGLWAHHKRPNSYDANNIAPTRRALKAYKSFLVESHSVVAGDFNDNVIFRPIKGNHHTMTLDELGGIGLTSAYHEGQDIIHGREPDATIYWRDRRIDGHRYHIDYCFVPREWIKSTSVVVGAFEQWVAKSGNRKGLSDHVPLIVELDDLVVSELSAQRRGNNV